MINKFKEILIERLNSLCHKSRATRDYTRECVILKDGKRIEINGVRVWSSEIYARNAIQRIINNEHYCLNSKSIWTYKACNQGYYKKVPDNIEEVALKVRQKWVKEHLRVIPLKDFILFEHNRNRSNDEG